MLRDACTCPASWVQLMTARRPVPLAVEQVGSTVLPDHDHGDHDQARHLRAVMSAISSATQCPQLDSASMWPIITFIPILGQHAAVISISPEPGHFGLTVCA